MVRIGNAAPRAIGEVAMRRRSFDCIAAGPPRIYGLGPAQGSLAGTRSECSGGRNNRVALPRLSLRRAMGLGGTSNEAAKTSSRRYVVGWANETWVNEATRLYVMRK